MGQCQPKDQTTWTIFIVGIILDDLADGDGFTKFLHTDMAHDALINSVLGKLKRLPAIFSRISSIIAMGQHYTGILLCPLNISEVSRTGDAERPR